jgi:hypothetical protein
MILSQLSQVPFEQKPSLQGSELWKPVALCTVKKWRGAGDGKRRTGRNKPGGKMTSKGEEKRGSED